MPDDSLHDFDRGTFTHDGKTRTVFRQGTGPAVIVIAEIPGITPKVLEFARRVSAIGCTAVLPHLFGRPGQAYPHPDVDGWLHLGLVEVVPAARRHGFARAVSAALAGWGAEQGASRVVLQVEQSNEPALRLYASLGFVTHHTYVTYHLP